MWEKNCSADPQGSTERRQKEREPNKYLAPAAPRSILGALSSSESHLHKPRGAQRHKGNNLTQIMDLEEGTPCLGTFLGCLRRASALWSTCDGHQDKSMLEPLWDLGGAPAYKYGIQGKSILGLCKSIYGMFRGGFMKKSVVYCRWNFRLSFISVIQLKLLTQLCFHSFQPNFPGRL